MVVLYFLRRMFQYRAQNIFNILEMKISSETIRENDGIFFISRNNHWRIIKRIIDFYFGANCIRPKSTVVCRYSLSTSITCYFDNTVLLQSVTSS